MWGSSVRPCRLPTSQYAVESALFGCYLAKKRTEPPPRFSFPLLCGAFSGVVLSFLDDSRALESVNGLVLHHHHCEGATAAVVLR